MHRNITRWIVITGAVSGLTGFPAAAVPPLGETLAKIVEREAASGAFAGAVLVEKDGEVLLRKGCGLANAEHGIPNSPDGIFLIGSLTKQFTAAGVLLLVQDGKLGIDDAACRYLGGCPASWSRVTIRQLLQHTSGIPDLVRLPDFGATMTLPTTLEKTLQRLAREPLLWTPGTKYEYGNSGFLIAARLIEGVSGVPYDVFMRTRVFEPLGMTRSGYAFHESVLPLRASGYMRRKGVLENASYLDMSIPAGAGSQYSTLDDLLRWHRELRTGRILNASSRALLFEPGIGGYALGWHVTEHAGRRTGEHIGDINGYGSYIVRGLTDDFVVVVLSNIEGAPVKRISVSLIDALLGVESAGPAF